MRAGVKKFEALKEFNVLYSLAGGNALELDRAFNLDYNTAHMVLYRRALESRYHDKLQEVIQNKHK